MCPARIRGPEQITADYTLICPSRKAWGKQRRDSTLNCPLRKPRLHRGYADRAPQLRRRADLRGGAELGKSCFTNAVQEVTLQGTLRHTRPSSRPCGMPPSCLTASGPAAFSYPAVTWVLVSVGGAGQILTPEGTFGSGARHRKGKHGALRPRCLAVSRPQGLRPSHIRPLPGCWYLQVAQARHSHPRERSDPGPGGRDIHTDIEPRTGPSWKKAEPTPTGKQRGSWGGCPVFRR